MRPRPGLPVIVVQCPDEGSPHVVWGVGELCLLLHTGRILVVKVPATYQGILAQSIQHHTKYKEHDSSQVIQIGRTRATGSCTAGGRRLPRVASRTSSTRSRPKRDMHFHQLLASYQGLLLCTTPKAGKTGQLLASHRALLLCTTPKAGEAGHLLASRGALLLCATPMAGRVHQERERATSLEGSCTCQFFSTSPPWCERPITSNTWGRPSE